VTQEISLCGEQLLLLPERALWWPAQCSLILSDLHWGKSAHFRKHGIPMPGATQQQDAMRLAQIVQRFHAERLIIAGDLFHSRHNSEVDSFAHWRNAHAALHIDFILGNHDILPAECYDALGLQPIAEGLALGPFFIAHDAMPVPGYFTIHGHLHPGMSVAGAGRFPVFAVGERSLVLPAFGKFTGCKSVAASEYRQVFLVGEGKVLRLK
jgi:DNA ligase-associated metallophosphoesterase